MQEINVGIKSAQVELPVANICRDTETSKASQSSLSAILTSNVRRTLRNNTTSNMSSPTTTNSLQCLSWMLSVSVRRITFTRHPSIAALEAGKHVICEKPIAGNAIDGQAMVDAQKASGKVLQIGLQSRFNPEARTLRKLYEDGFFGDIYYARAMAMRRRGVPATPSFITKSIAGGGPLIDIGVHILDVLLWMIGAPKPIEAFGSVAQKFGNRANVINDWGTWIPAQFDVEDFAMGAIRL